MIRLTLDDPRLILEFVTPFPEHKEAVRAECNVPSIIF